MIVADGMMKQGLLKMHAVTAHLNYSDVGLLERMSPLVIIKINMQEWRNEPCYEGGKNPSWGAINHMEHAVMDVMQEVYIEVRDKEMFGSDMIGHARVPLNFFCRPEGHLNEWIELKKMGFDAGRIHIRSEYIPEMMMSGGGGGGGAGKAIAAGAIIGTVAAVDIMEHDNHRRGHEQVIVVNEHHGRRGHEEVVVVHEGHHGHRR